MSVSSMLGSAGGLLGMGLDLWNKNNEYQLEKKRIEYAQAQEANQKAQAAQQAAASLSEMAQRLQINTLIKWVGIGIIGLIGGKMLFGFVSKQLKG